MYEAETSQFREALYWHIPTRNPPRIHNVL